MTRFVGSIWALLGLLLIPQHALAERKLGVREAEKLALQQNASLQAARVRLRAGHEGLSSTRGHLLPALSVSDEYQHYDSPFLFPAIPGFPPLNFAVRNQDTNTFIASFHQPLLGLIGGVETYRGQQMIQAANEAQLKVAEEQVRTQVRVGYLRYFEANALKDIARSSQQELTEQVTVAQARVKAGVLTNADVLRVQVALANARQQEIVAKTNADVARATLLIACGLQPDDASIELGEPSELLAAGKREVPAYAAAHTKSLQLRPAVVQGQRLADAADRQRKAKLFAFLPDVNLDGAYIHVDGQQLQPSDSAYVGIKAQWTFWEWGSTYYSYKAARAQAEAALLDLEAVRLQISVEVATDLAQTTAAQSAVQVAEQTITSAEEAYRVTVALVKAGSATTTDLLDSQSALTQARLSLTRAQYEQAIAYVQLAHTLGEHDS